MSTDSTTFSSEVEMLREQGLTHVGVVYALGYARAITNLKLSVLLKVLKDLPKAANSDEQLIRVSSVLSTGNLAEAKALIAGFMKQLQSPDSSLSFSSLGEPLGNEIPIAGNSNPSKREPCSADLSGGSQSEVHKPSHILREEHKGLSDDIIAQMLDAKQVSECNPLLGDNDQELLCFICRQPISEEDLLPLDACGHILHSHCIAQHIMSQVKALHFPVTCPLSDCETEISHIDLKELLNAEAYIAYEEASFKSYLSGGDNEIVSCQTPGCSFVFSWTGEGPEFQCPFCKNSYCITCKTPWHNYLTCEQHQRQLSQEAENEIFSRNMRYKQCAVCLRWLEKQLGSNLMECACGNKFCFKCNDPWKNCICQKADRRSFFGNVSSMFKSAFKR